MDNLQNTSAEGTQTSTEGTQKSGKIFTQEDVNRIVQERLAKERIRHLATRNLIREQQSWTSEPQILKQKKTG